MMGLVTNDVVLFKNASVSNCVPAKNNAIRMFMYCIRLLLLLLLLLLVYIIDYNHVQR